MDCGIIQLSNQPNQMALALSKIRHSIRRVIVLCAIASSHPSSIPTSHQGPAGGTMAAAAAVAAAVASPNDTGATAEARGCTAAAVKASSVTPASLSLPAAATVEVWSC